VIGELGFRIDVSLKNRIFACVERSVQPPDEVDVLLRNPNRPPVKSLLSPEPKRGSRPVRASK
jgi:hypothetical protein